MNRPIKFTPAELAFADAANARLSANSRKAITLDQLIAEWAALVQEIEDGYNWTSYEYANDLAIRKILSEVIAEAPPSLRQKLIAMLDPLDLRFEQATREAPHPVGYTVTRESHPWWFRIPKRLCLELENDLRARGMLDETGAAPSTPAAQKEESS